MKIYSFTSPNYEGAAVCKYNSEGMLFMLEIEVSVWENKKAHQWLSDYLPRHTDHIPKMTEFNWLTVKEIAPDLSFDTWFTLYSDLMGSRVSKLRAEKLWKKMTDSHKMAAFEISPQYSKWSRHKTYEMAFPDKFLRNEMYLSKFTIR